VDYVKKFCKKWFCLLGYYHIVDEIFFVKVSVGMGRLSETGILLLCNKKITRILAVLLSLYPFLSSQFQVSPGLDPTAKNIFVNLQVCNNQDSENMGNEERTITSKRTTTHTKTVNVRNYLLLKGFNCKYNGFQIQGKSTTETTTVIGYSDGTTETKTTTSDGSEEEKPKKNEDVATEVKETEKKGCCGGKCELM